MWAAVEIHSGLQMPLIKNICKLSEISDGDTGDRTTVWNKATLKKSKISSLSKNTQLLIIKEWNGFSYLSYS